MKKNRIDFKEKRRYAIKKVSGKTASVFIGATIFGIILSSNLSIVNTKADTVSNTPATTISNDQTSDTSNGVILRNNQKAESSASNGVPEKVQQNGASNDVTEKVQQNSGSNNATANNSTESAPTSQSSPETQGSAGTDINSSAFMNLMAASDTGTDINSSAFMNLMAAPGSDRNAGDTVDQNNINDQPAKENQKLANEHNLTSSDNYSSNIYKGTDGKYYKIVTIYGNDYVYHAADIQANGDDTTAEDTKNNINISKEDLGNGKTRWTVVFFPKKGLQNVGSNLSGLQSAKFGIALTNDYKILGNVDMDVISDPNQSYVAHTFKPGSYSATDITVQNPPTEVDFSFNPKTDVDQNTGLINSKTMPAYNNKYLQGPYYFTTATDTGKKNLWQTYFKKWGVFSNGSNNAYDETPYLGNDHELHFSDFNIRNKTGVDGAKQGDLVIYDKLGYDKFNGKLNSDGVFSSYNFNQAMEFKSQGATSQAQFSSYVVSFTTQHTDSYEVNLDKGPKNQQFSGISANIYSWQNSHYNMFSSLYGEQRALNAAGVAKTPKDVISGWGDATRAIGQMEKDYLNNAQINVLRNKILNNITDPDAVNNIIKEGNSLNTAMKNLGNSIGQYDPDGSFADHKVDTTKASDRYKYANPDKQEAYDNATEVTKALINKDTGTYADQATVEKLTKAENKAWNELNGVVNAAKKAIDEAAKTKDAAIDNSSLTAEEKDTLKQTVAAEGQKAKDNIDAATKDADVKTAQTTGEEAINAVEISASVSKTDAIKAINAALTDKKAEINGTNLTDEEKTAVINKAQKLADDAIADINKATTNDAVNTAKENGVQAIKNMTIPTVSDVKKNAKNAIDQAAKAKDDAIDASNLTAEEKADLKKIVAAEGQKAKAAIDAATKDADVKTAQTTGEEAINNINVHAASATKDAAKDAIDDALAKKIEEINNANLTDDQKQSLIDQAQNAANQAKENVRSASTDEDVQTAKNNGIAAINGITVKSNSVDDQDNSATNEGNGNQAGHIQSDNSSDVTKHSSIQQSGNEKTQLPQTGNETQRGAGLVGLAIAGLVGLLGSAGFRKKRD